jgi:hypothetical protein
VHFATCPGSGERSLEVFALFTGGNSGARSLVGFEVELTEKRVTRVLKSRIDRIERREDEPSNATAAGSRPGKMTIFHLSPDSDLEYLKKWASIPKTRSLCKCAAISGPKSVSSTAKPWVRIFESHCEHRPIPKFQD